MDYRAWIAISNDSPPNAARRARLVRAMNASWMPTAAVLMGVLFQGGCNTQPSRLAAIQQLAQANSDAADLLATVKDKASATAAAQKMQELSARMKQLGGQLEAEEAADDLAFSEEPELSAHAIYTAA